VSITGFAYESLMSLNRYWYLASMEFTLYTDWQGVLTTLVSGKELEQLQE